MTARAIGLGFAAWCVLSFAAIAQTAHIEAAADLLSKGDLAQAETEARKALTVPAMRPLALAMLGTIRLQQGKNEESIRFLEQALALNPRLVGARTTLGNAYGFSGKPELAARSFREVLREDPGNLDARFDLFKLEASRRHFQQSLDLAAPILQQILQSDEGLVALASDYGALGKKQDLAGLATQWQRLPQAGDDSAMDFGATLLLYGLRSEATDVLEAEEVRLAAHPTSLLALKLGNAFLTLGLFDHAEKNVQLALSLERDCTACYETVARVADAQANSEKALAYMVAAKKLAPQDPEVLFEFGKVCLERNLVDDAMPALSKAVEMQPGNDSYQYVLGSANVALRHFPEALTLFQKLLNRHPHDAVLMYAIGAVHYLEGKYGEAETWLKQSLSAQPDQVAASYYLALTYAGNGDDEHAMPILRELVKNHPQHVASHVKLGSLLVRTHQYDEAQTILDRAVALDPDSVEAHYQRGLLLRRLGKAADSESEFAQSRKLEAEQHPQQDMRLRLLLPD